MASYSFNLHMVGVTTQVNTYSIVLKLGMAFLLPLASMIYISLCRGRTAKYSHTPRVALSLLRASIN